MRLPSLPTAMATSVGVLAVAFSTLPVPQPVVAATGLSMVFFVPGFAVSSIALPTISAVEERLLASVGLSLVVATCAAVLLAGTRIGLTRDSLDLTLGVASIMFPIITAILRQARSSAGSVQG